jgi:hypothetical protein
MPRIDGDDGGSKPRIGSGHHRARLGLDIEQRRRSRRCDAQYITAAVFIDREPTPGATAAGHRLEQHALVLGTGPV